MSTKKELRKIDQPNFKFSRLSRDNQDYLNGFCCGSGEIDRYVQEDALSDCCNGNGVTYLVIDSNRKQLIAYYTLATTALRSTGYSSAEIKMFAVGREYQDTYFEIDETKRLVSDTVLRIVINDLIELSQNVIGFKYIVLHSVPNAVKFYKRNEFHEMKKKYMMFDTDYTEGCIPMYMKLYKDDWEKQEKFFFTDN